MCNLPGNTTQQKVDAILEMEADCNLDEACLMKVFDKLFQVTFHLCPKQEIFTLPNTMWSDNNTCI